MTESAVTFAEQNRTRNHPRKKAKTRPVAAASVVAVNRRAAVPVAVKTGHGREAAGQEFAAEDIGTNRFSHAGNLAEAGALSMVDGIL